MKEKEIDQLMKALWIQVGVALGIALLLILLFEYDILPQGLLAGDVLMDYVLQITTILLTLVCIPFSLKLYSQAVSKHRPENDLSDGIRNLKHWSGRRLFTIALPLYVGIITYYLTMSVSNLFCALIAGITLTFCIPVRERVVEQIDIPVDE